MKMLFISNRDVNKKDTGGFQCTNRNYLSFCELLGYDNVVTLNLTSGLERSISNSISKRINKLFGFSWGLSHNTLKKIIKTSKEYDYIFIDQSSYGVIAYFLKNVKYSGKIICFFHNVEYNIERQNIKLSPLSFFKIFLLRFFEIPIIYYNEKKACKYSDMIVALNKRDSAELQRIYKATNVNIIPISLSDTFKNEVKEFTSIPPTFLFIGNNWLPNIQGLKWFIHNVLDLVKIKLQIVGSGMEAIKKEFIHPKIEFLGYVSDLSSILMNADYIISPIFIGSGMKVKTCESLMYGKNIIGTSEAFEGYEIDYQKVGAICNNKEEFILFIKNHCYIRRKKFNEFSRNYFVEKYSFQATLKKFNDLLVK
jgi:glycosyltransferase involved in cell wall biosynthesis